ncbi:hypothetical protein PC116_g20378 [Phytophthora cactorum]|uniref:Uncharacterized protein n=1 Tax=Phytophthora cactorum TaxID=29920 RepID=A0A8T1E5N0_9STRA|nr:hypothetical protein PC112_g16174 [Phytophthora cactorum]KAG2811657.1 hypothetical protein PC111_g15153 [Phytophthora cactorum]KAG2889783.1 hypothetical protein PC114_g17790 [Phytophthora cactorum]KAG2946465.1 hypothetical protein PC117_g7598 [Phytophthora cactorum]KAG2971790.1 hypothetical protein PC118_g16090 [Phytophthora cactorum]
MTWSPKLTEKPHLAESTQCTHRLFFLRFSLKPVGRNQPFHLEKSSLHLHLAQAWGPTRVRARTKSSKPSQVLPIGESRRSAQSSYSSGSPEALRVREEQIISGRSKKQISHS